MGTPALQHAIEGSSNIPKEKTSSNIPKVLKPDLGFRDYKILKYDKENTIFSTFERLYYFVFTLKLYNLILFMQ